MSTLQRLWLRTSFTAGCLAAGVPAALADDFGGPLPNIPGTVEGNDTEAVRDAIIRALILVLNFLALIAVIFIVVAGIRLIVSQGEEEQKEKSKKTILYVIIGLIIILFARLIVGFFASNPFGN